MKKYILIFLLLTACESTQKKPVLEEIYQKPTPSIWPNITLPENPHSRQ